MAELELSTVIMAHPRRAESAVRLRDSCPELDLRIVYDPEPEAPPSTLRTASLAWSSIAEGATHQLVLQDDVVLCDDFAAQLHAAVASMSDSPVFLYTDWGTKCSHALRLAALRGVSWAEGVDPWVPAQAVLLPADMARGFIGYVTERPHLDDDALALEAYLRENKITASVCMPNLVQHGGIPSLLGNDTPMGLRRSNCFAAAEDWTRPQYWTNASLSGLTAVPDLLVGRSVCWTRPADDPYGWTSTPTYEWLAARGLPVFDQMPLFHEASTALAGSTCREMAGETLLFHLWLTGFLHGVIAATWPEADADWLTDALERPLVRRSQATLVPGGLRELLAEPYLAAASEAFLPLVRRAMYQGLETNAKWELLSPA
jgi:hypothetical protein